MNQLQSLDTIITNLLVIIIPHNQFIDTFFSFFSLQGNALLVWIIAIIISIVVEEVLHPGIQKRDIKFIVYFLVIFAFTTIFVNYGLKNIVRRERPILNSKLLILNCPKDFSFPSGHAATAFAAAAVLAYFDKKHKYFYYMVAVFIAYSRIYLGCHYFLDVVCGAIIGFLISKMSLAFLNHLKPSSIHPHTAGKT